MRKSHPNRIAASRTNLDGGEHNRNIRANEKLLNFEPKCGGNVLRERLLVVVRGVRFITDRYDRNTSTLRKRVN
jgi:hypothetical protein